MTDLTPEQEAARQRAAERLLQAEASFRREGPITPDELGQLTPEQQAAIARARAQAEPQSGFAESVSEPFVRGFTQTLDLPANLMNLALAGGQRAYNAMTDGDTAPMQMGTLTGTLQNQGLLATEPAEGLIPRTMEIAGGSALPAGLLLQHGRKAVDVLPQSRSMVQNMTAAAAQQPGTVTAGDLAASFTAAAGGEIAEEFTEDPAIIALAELGGGFSPVVFMSSPAVRATRAIGRGLQKHLLPFTKGGARQRASERLRTLTQDLETATARLKENNNLVEVSPARQTGDPNLIALENRILMGDPQYEGRYSQELQDAIEQLRRSAIPEGDPEHPRRLLELRARQAAEEAQLALDAMDPNATPRQISATARQHVDQAYRDARATESRLWGALDQDADVQLARSQERLQAELAQRSQFSDPDDIPDYVVRALVAEPDPAVMRQLEQAGLLNPDGSIPPNVQAAIDAQGIYLSRPITLRDAQALRSRVLADIRATRAQPGYSRNRVRILSDIEQALLDDMGRVANSEGARQFSAALNERFTRGYVGRLLGFERRGGQSVLAEDTLQNAVFGSASATELQRLTETSSEALDETMNFVRASYLRATQNADWSFNHNLSDTFIRNLRRNGVFEVMPDLERELLRVRELSDAARRLEIRDTPTNRLGNVDRASVYLNAPVGEEMAYLLRNQNSAEVARAVMAQMGGDEQAIRGLQAAFVDEVWRSSMKDGAINGRTLRLTLEENARVAEILIPNQADRARLMDIARTVERATMPVQAGRVERVMDDAPSHILDFLARVLGARAGARFSEGSEIGAGMVMAQAGSQRMRGLLQRLTTDHAEQLLIAAHQDPVLYRALMTKPTDPIPDQDRAAAIIEPWIIGVVATQGEE